MREREKGYDSAEERKKVSVGEKLGLEMKPKRKREELQGPINPESGKKRETYNIGSRR